MSDVYRELPPELIAVLRDPRVILPGEMEVFENVSRWVDASPHHGPSVYIDAQGNTIPVRSDT